jgi:3-oxoacyl-[acyl-carrier protein] reductase
MAESGAHVVVTDVDLGAVHSVVETLERDGASASGFELDVTDARMVEHVVDQVAQEVGDVTAIVNLAGALRNQVVEKIDDDDFEFVLATHLKGTLHTMRAVIPGMRANGFGRIVNLSSVAARGSIAGGAYGAAKGGVEGLTRSAAMEVARHGITVNCVAPGLINAGMFLTVDAEYQKSCGSAKPRMSRRALRSSRRAPLDM